ncbi:MAG: hypothetical protein AYK18_13670 [Theionarchaea archaeon DG-70]|nr:MAG: hypothetical protein AYK18_13670 [Theionarchaea archaeon DG-70]
MLVPSQNMLSVIFVEPESPGNIGSIARCMKNFGAETLILVNPCSLKGAQKMAMHAQDIVEKAAITNTLSDALKLVDTSIATTSKPGGLLREAITPGELTHISGDVGIVIGRESSGLTNAEIDKCDFLISIPTSEEYPAMNASSACCIILYEFFKCREKIERKIMNRKRIMEEFIRISELIEKRQHRKRIWKIVMNRILTRAFLSERESTVLLGIFRRIRTVLEATP